MKITCFIPIHNEQTFLPYSLPSVFNLTPDQIILILDRCTDKSEEVIYSLIDKFRYTPNTELIKVTEIPSAWRWPLSYLMNLAVKHTHNKILFAVNADSTFTPELKTHLNKFQDEKVGWISFGYNDYPLTWDSWLKNQLQKRFTRRTPRGINYAFRHGIFRGLDFLKARFAVDNYIFNGIREEGLETLFFRSNTQHLRPTHGKYDFIRGYNKYLQRQSLARVLLTSTLYLKPKMLAGFMKAKY